MLREGRDRRSGSETEAGVVTPDAANLTVPRWGFRGRSREAQLPRRTSHPVSIPVPVPIAIPLSFPLPFPAGPVIPLLMPTRRVAGGGRSGQTGVGGRGGGGLLGALTLEAGAGEGTVDAKGAPVKGERADVGGRHGGVRTPPLCALSRHL